MSSSKRNLILLIATTVLLTIGFATKDRTIDFNIHDTYFVIGNLHFAILILSILLLLGIVYWFIFKLGLKLSNVLVWIHLGVTYVGALLALTLSQFYGEELMSLEYYDHLFLIILSVSFGQVLLVVNILVGLFNSLNQTGS